MATLYERVKAAWESGDRRPMLQRAVEQMAAEGVTRDELDAALGQLLDEVRAGRADEETEEIILSLGDRLHGWCHPSRHIETREVGSTSNGTSQNHGGLPARPNPTVGIDPP